jgi:hypothetical protein
MRACVWRLHRESRSPCRVRRVLFIFLSHSFSIGFTRFHYYLKCARGSHLFLFFFCLFIYPGYTIQLVEKVTSDQFLGALVRIGGGWLLLLKERKKRDLNNFFVTTKQSEANSIQ